MRMMLMSRVAARMLIGLLLVSSQMAFQPAKALSLIVLCTEADGRTVVEFGAGGKCQHPPFAAEESISAFASVYCEGCTDRALHAEPSPTIGSKRGEAPRTVLPTGPPVQPAGYAVFASDVAPAAAPSGLFRPFCDVAFRDPFLLGLRSVRLLT
jgi:hypothetical protein